MSDETLPPMVKEVAEDNMLVPAPILLAEPIPKSALPEETPNLSITYVARTIPEETSSSPITLVNRSHTPTSTITLMARSLPEETPTPSITLMARSLPEETPTPSITLMARSLPEITSFDMATLQGGTFTWVSQWTRGAGVDSSSYVLPTESPSHLLDTTGEINHPPIPGPFKRNTLLTMPSPSATASAPAIHTPPVELPTLASGPLTDIIYVDHSTKQCPSNSTTDCNRVAERFRVILPEGTLAGLTRTLGEHEIQLSPLPLAIVMGLAAAALFGFLGFMVVELFQRCASIRRERKQKQRKVEQGQEERTDV